MRSNIMIQFLIALSKKLDLYFPMWRVELTSQDYTSAG